MENVITSEELLGIAKRVNKDLEPLPLESHGSVLSVLNQLCEHRQLTMRRLMEDQKNAAQQAIWDRQQKLAEAEQDRQRKAQAAADSKIITLA